MQQSFSLKQRGINLIELMVVVGIVAIIGAIAYPAFTAQILKSNRIDAKRILMQVQSAYERYYNENTNAYPTVGVSATYNSLSLGSPPSSSFYTFSAASSTGGYTLSASATGNQTGDTTCTNFYLDYLGNQTSTNNAAGSTSCW